MKKIFIQLILLLILQSLFSISKINYYISFENRIHHEAVIRVEFRNLQNKPLIINMSRSSPGNYALFEFSKNIYDEKAYDIHGLKLEITRPNQHQWIIKKHNGDVIFQYTLFADHLDGTFSSISNNHIFLNIPATFVWAKELENIPIEINIKNPEINWHIITQLIKAGNDIYKAPNLDYFIDSPIAIADFTVFEWHAESNGKKQKIRLAVNQNDSKENLSDFRNFTERIVLGQMKVFGELPEFDFGEYTFITAFLPTAIYDGMEHRNSTVITSNFSLKKDMLRNLRMLSHEFFHVWNAERIRPKTLEPFNLMETNMSDELWFVEGFSAYYQDVILYRQGIINIDQLVEFLAVTINYVYNYPGSNIYSAVKMSQKATLFNGSIYKDATNLSNIYISYYSYGAVIALALDLMLKTEFQSITLDDYMKKIWTLYGKTGINYTNDDLLKVLAELTGNDYFAQNFFNRYIYGNELPDLKSLLAKAGVSLKKKYPGSASLGRSWIYTNQNNRVIINTYTQKNEPVYKVGIDKGDTILQLENIPIKSTSDIFKILSKYKPDDLILIKFQKKNGKIISDYIKLEEERTLIAVTYEANGLKITDDIIKFRNNWLMTKISLSKNTKK